MAGGIIRCKVAMHFMEVDDATLPCTWIDNKNLFTTDNMQYLLMIT